MKHSLKIALAISATVLVSACSKADMDYFLASGPGDWSAAGSTYESWADSANLDTQQQRASNVQCVNSGGRLVGNTCTGRY